MATMQAPAVVPPPPQTKPSKSQFIEKLHDLLEHPYDPDSMRWISNTAFEITCNDALARRALSAKWEFRSLSSFIRQLSYYNFKRLSDRRRSGERKSAQTSFIVFTHPSGYFVRGDSSMLHGIARKTRNKTKGATGGRRASQASTASNDRSDESPPPPVPAWQPPQFAPQYGDDRRSLSSMLSYHPLPIGSSSYASPFGAGSAHPPASFGDQLASWRSYHPSASGWNIDSGGHAATGDYGMKRTSVGDIRPTMPISPRGSRDLDLPPPHSHHAQQQSIQHPADQHAHRTSYHHPLSTQYRKTEAACATGEAGAGLYQPDTSVPSYTHSHLTYDAYPPRVASGLTLPFDVGQHHPQHAVTGRSSVADGLHQYHHHGSHQAPYMPYQHYTTSSYPIAATGNGARGSSSGSGTHSNPLPSPSYSDGGDLISPTALNPPQKEIGTSADEGGDNLSYTKSMFGRGSTDASRHILSTGSNAASSDYFGQRVRAASASEPVTNLAGGHQSSPPVSWAAPLASTKQVNGAMHGGSHAL
ncbi:hypothetical protein OIO90_006001 [Microbotryomycetes sp. JL221]|nr:hypothetical protein OIO90_006001 [Microbotryomycetes sp. JL221]